MNPVSRGPNSTTSNTQSFFTNKTVASRQDGHDGDEQPTSQFFEVVEKPHLGFVVGLIHRHDAKLNQPFAEAIVKVHHAEVRVVHHDHHLADALFLHPLGSLRSQG